MIVEAADRHVPTISEFLRVEHNCNDGRTGTVHLSSLVSSENVSPPPGTGYAVPAYSCPEFIRFLVQRRTVVLRIIDCQADIDYFLSHRRLRFSLDRAVSPTALRYPISEDSPRYWWRWGRLYHLLEK